MLSTWSTLNIRKGPELRFTQGHVTEWFVTLLEFESGFLQPWSLWPLQPCVPGETGLEGSSVLSSWVVSHQTEVHISVARGLLMWPRLFCGSTWRKERPWNSAPGSWVTQGSPVHRPNCVVRDCVSSLVLGKATYLFKSFAWCLLLGLMLSFSSVLWWLLSGKLKTIAVGCWQWWELSLQSWRPLWYLISSTRSSQVYLERVNIRSFSRLMGCDMMGQAVDPKRSTILRIAKLWLHKVINYYPCQRPLKSHKKC